MSQFLRQSFFMKISKKNPSTPVEAQEPGFTYLTNHTHVLVSLNANAELRVRDLAAAIGITERAVQRIIADLEAVGVLEHEKIGRRNSYKIHRQARLRHQLEGHCTVGGLLDWVEKSARQDAKRNG
jgi:DNA-binding MarR family transcriptional regulator